MFETLFIAFWPCVFMTLIYGGGVKLRRQNIDMDGRPPIDRRVFAGSKLAMFIPWAAMIVQSLGPNLGVFEIPGWLRWTAVGLWSAAFAITIAGRIGLGSSFRVGCAEEKTRLRDGGIFRFSRNPIYLGLYASILASALYTRQPVVWLAGAFVIVVHHRIVLAEEECLNKAFGDEYRDYRRRVRRYI